MSRRARAVSAGLQRLARPYVEAALAARRHEAVEVALEALEQTDGDLAAVYDLVLKRAAERIGDLWHIGSIGVADEHAATEFTLRAMSALRERVEPKPIRPGRLVLACPQGERHDIGLRMVADVLDLEGYEVHFLGADTPTAALVAYADKVSADAVGLSCATPFSVDGLLAAIPALREADADRPILVGGGCLERFPGLLAGRQPTGIAVRASDARELFRHALERRGSRAGSPSRSPL